MRGLFRAAVVWACLLAQAHAQSQSLAEIPISYSGGLLWVRVSVPQSSEPLNFLLDSGAGTSVLTRQTAQRLDIKLLQHVSVRGVGTQTVGYWTEPLVADIGGVRLSQKFLAVDLQKLSAACGQHVDGLLGSDFFRGRVVQIDYAAERIRLLASSPASAIGQVLPLRVLPNALCVPIHVNGNESQWLRLDTGCAAALHWVCADHPPTPLTCQLSIGLTEISTPVVQTTVELGTERCKDVPTRLHQREIFPGESGLLGNGLLSRYRITIDAPRGRAVLE